MPDKAEKERIIINDEPFFAEENGEIWYSLGKTRDEGAEICRQILKAVATKRNSSSPMN